MTHYAPSSAGTPARPPPLSANNVPDPDLDMLEDRVATELPPSFHEGTYDLRFMLNPWSSSSANGAPCTVLVTCILTVEVFFP